jgi:hypothetical protein
MATSGKQGKAICREPRDVNHVNRLCKQEAVEKSLIWPICRTDERTAKCWGVSVTTVNKSEEKTEMKGALYTPRQGTGLENLKEM